MNFTAFINWNNEITKIDFEMNLERFIHLDKTEIIYARNTNLNHFYIPKSELFNIKLLYCQDNLDITNPNNWDR